jgi:excisionase family DNA binding protein
MKNFFWVVEMDGKKCLAADAARILGVTPAAVRAMHARGELPAIRTGTGVRVFDREDVIRLAAKRDAERDAGRRR